MGTHNGIPVHELAHLRGQTGVFGDRAIAGQVLAGMLHEFRGGDALLLALPAGGVIVSAVIARRLHLEYDVAVVSKITPPSNTEWGFGAVAFDGSVLLDDRLVGPLNLDEAQIAECIRQTREKVRRRVDLLREGRALGDLGGRDVIVVDDGLATGITMRAALQALARAGAGRRIVAVPTAHETSVRALVAAEPVGAVYCANLRGGPSFAVADAYEYWRDLTDETVLSTFEQYCDGADNPVCRRREP